MRVSAVSGRDGILSYYHGFVVCERTWYIILSLYS